ncbi:unnamed protein product, partial [Closterium sp. NIES-64]
ASGELTLTWNMLLKVVVQVATEAWRPAVTKSSSSAEGSGAGSNRGPGVASGELVFSWSMRLKVAVQVAAEAYMHLGDEYEWRALLQLEHAAQGGGAGGRGTGVFARSQLHSPGLKASNVLLSPVSRGFAGKVGGLGRLRDCTASTGLAVQCTGSGALYHEYDAKLTGFGMEYDAKLTDFGMVRVGPDRQLQSIVSTRIMGTRGYTDPSYMETGHLGAKSDVYSFGVLLLELVTGRRVVDEGEKMVIECRTRLSDLTRKAAEYIDPHLGNQYPERGARGLATLARHCVADDRRTRPEIGAVLEKLKLLVRACESDEAEAAAETAALERGGLGSVERGGMEVTGGEEGSLVAVTPVVVVA